MYKFIVEAGTAMELEDKLDQFAIERMKSINDDQFADEDERSEPTFDPAPLMSTEAEEVVNSFETAETATVPHLYQAPQPSIDRPGFAKTPENKIVITNTDELDSRGLPWDSRIHSTARSKNQDGTWRNKRNVDPLLLARVEKEISHITTQSNSPSFAVPPIPPVPISPAPASMPDFKQLQVNTDVSLFDMDQAAPRADRTVTFEHLGGQPGSANGIPQVQAREAQYRQAPPLIEPTQYQQVAPAPVQPPVQPVAPPVLSVPDQTQHKSPAEILNDAQQNTYSNVAIPATTKPAHTLASFTDNLVQVLAQLINEKKINQDYIQQLCEHFQVKNIWNVTASGVKTRELYDSFGEFGFITKLD